MPRETSSKGLARPRAARAKLKPGHLHRHGCVQCGQLYNDACSSPHDNARCQLCRTGYRRPLWERDMDPISCCRINSRKARTEDRDRYALGGETEWWLCRSCARTHPYDPTGTGATS
jgi:hypothetical protein